MDSVPIEFSTISATTCDLDLATAKLLFRLVGPAEAGVPEESTDERLRRRGRWRPSRWLQHTPPQAAAGESTTWRRAGWRSARTGGAHSGAPPASHDLAHEPPVTPRPMSATVATSPTLCVAPEHCSRTPSTITAGLLRTCRNDPSEECGDGGEPLRAEGVVQVPEPVSPRNRSRVRGVSGSNEATVSPSYRARTQELGRTVEGSLQGQR